MYQQALLLVAISLGAVLAQGNFGHRQTGQRNFGGPAILTSQTTPIPIVRSFNQNNGDGSYQFNYETGNGINQEESGFLKNPGTDNEIQTVKGSYSYYSPDGQLLTVTYIADENGFQAFGDHLPKPHPEIQKGLDLIYANAAKQRQAPQNNFGNNNNRFGNNRF